ncbi:amidase signature domain-containing protein [Cadophora sp. MPI-SDFR-AT-0126]|nr:amidase signature domain-containing protein [Leotiomycetes sp. MPI-SDFR-AT-0126]
MNSLTAHSEHLDTEAIHIGDLKYLRGEAVGTVLSSSSVCRNDNSPVPVTVIDISELASINSAVIHNHSRARLAHLSSRDDVFQEPFTKNLLFRTSLVPAFSWKCDHKDLGLFHFQSDLPREGPYFLIGTTLHKVFRLYQDVYNAFMYGMVQSDDSTSFDKSPIRGYIPVPSRLYDDESVDRPLAGKRIAVKDIYDIQGLVTEASSKAYARLGKPAATTARCIRTLLDLGAVIVGKAKTVQFASGMSAGDWTETVSPTNPRGDQHLDPNCSSSGSAASVAGYEWLDYAVGSDSEHIPFLQRLVPTFSPSGLGSMTGPAAACGIFGVRPSTGILSNDGALPVSVHLDTPGCFTRSITDLASITSRWLEGASIRHGEIASHLAKAIQVFIRMQLDPFGGFLADLERYCGVNSTSFNISNRWESKRPPGTSPSVEEYLATTVAHIQLHDSYHNNLKFRNDYMAIFDEKPSVEPLIQFKWDLGSKLSDDQYDRACEEKRNFKEFVEKEVFIDRTIMIFPGDFPGPSYRDEVSRTCEERKKWQGYGLQNTTFSVLGGLPAVVLPVGERKYLSKFSGKDEKQPISVMIVGPRGSDNWLIGCLERVWKESGRPVSVKVGTSMF